MTQPIATSSELLTRYLTEKPDEMVKKHTCKNRLYQVALVVSAIGAMAILGSVSAIYLGLFGEVTLSGWATLGAFVTSVLMLQGVDTFAKWQIAEAKEMRWYQKLNAESESIKHWNETAVRHFFSDHRHPIQQMPPILQRLNPSRPLLALLPLIARCKLVEKSALKWAAKEQAQQTAMKNLNGLPQHFQGPILKIHQALAARAEQKKQHYATCAVGCLELSRT
jgi:hypothetical protein